ncbi:uncharacterized protein BJ212DRAFT_133515 [Suillus subaureus]|uniref:Uncharacterized protein n=1 Tax=Suillus subaureus TaxID=48587 RepID=A0A9P7DPM4_9AGAM|nr:uncharacterized protein BJ212DRAFT_133515 [Suillus subaureus]KAG1800053.1 hypothetical protein BJ212DRAFT_133515 [Suillus subaureus]
MPSSQLNLIWYTIPGVSRCEWTRSGCHCAEVNSGLCRCSGCPGTVDTWAALLGVEGLTSFKMKTVEKHNRTSSDDDPAEVGFHSSASFCAFLSQVSTTIEICFLWTVQVRNLPITRLFFHRNIP